jgi:hypothetical protein
MAWKAIGVERFRSYQEYQDMAQNLTAVQERCTQLVTQLRQYRQQLHQKDVLIQRLQAMLVMGSMVPIPEEIEGFINPEEVNDLPATVRPRSSQGPRSKRATEPAPSTGPGTVKIREPYSPESQRLVAPASYKPHTPGVD